ncbi:damage-inducible protein DinB [Aureimonas endophytica]|uniref:Damage-inducible protein DinB n=1 Tax=Aureimonas endophytica TaxID=2027858 RepID=A0A916ZCH2_9HYPH|nr:DinB family protein [Aureimonas endophytica]GGD85746.1 damage-inducible protein DinB [Aureimonas endophytica]
MSPHSIYAMLAAYNGWANDRLYDAAERLTHEEFIEDRGLFFRSMMGTLNHLLATDRIWLRRLRGEGEAPDRLDAVLFPEIEPLRAARLAEDRRLVAYVAGLDAARLAATITYSPLTKPGRIEQPVAAVLAHLFNHQTHHRGQAHALLTGFGRDAPSLDLVLFQRESGLGIGDQPE